MWRLFWMLVAAIVWGYAIVLVFGTLIPNVFLKSSNTPTGTATGSNTSHMHHHKTHRGYQPTVLGNTPGLDGPPLYQGESTVGTVTGQWTWH